MMKQTSRVVIVAALLLGIGVLGLHERSAAASSVITLRYRFQVGAQFTVRLARNGRTRIVSDQPGQSSTIDEKDRIDVHAVVAQVSPDGSAELQFKYTNAQGRSNNGGAGSLQNLSPTVRVAANGKMPGAVSTSSAQSQPFELPQLAQRPVAVGDEWATTPTLLQEIVSVPRGKPPKGAGFTLSTRSRARLLALTAVSATISERQFQRLQERRAGDTLIGTLALTRTETVALARIGLLKQHSESTLILTVKTKKVNGTITIHEVDDVVAIPNPAPPKVHPGLLATVVTAQVGPSPECVAVDPGTGHAFVGNTGNDTVTMLDAYTGKQLRTIVVGLGPQAMAFDAPRGEIVVVSGGSPASAWSSGLPHAPGSISILNSDTGRVLHTLHAGINPWKMALDRRHARAYIADNRNKILVVDTAHGRMRAPMAMPPGTRPTGVPIVDAPRERLYVLVTNDDNITGALVIVDTATDAILHVTPLQDHNLEKVAYDASTDHLFVTGEEQGEGVADLGTLTMLDATTGGILHVAHHFGTEPDNVVVAGRERRLFVVDQPDSQVLMADTHTGTLLRTIPVRDGPDIITMDEAGGRVFVAHDGGTLAAIDAASGTVLGYTDVGSLPFQVVVDRKSGHIFVANEGDDTVSVLASR